MAGINVTGLTNSHNYYSSLFSSLKTDSKMSGMYGSLGDMSMLKSGVYKKLVNAYYSNVKEAESEDDSDSEDTSALDSASEELQSLLSTNASSYSSDGTANTAASSSLDFYL